MNGYLARKRRRAAGGAVKVKALEAPPQQLARTREKLKVETKEITKTEVETKKKEAVIKAKKEKKKKKAKPRALANALFAGIGMARRLCFIIDCSGSMSADAGGMTRLNVVQMQLMQMLDTMEGQRGCAFGLLMFTHNCEFDAKLGNSMWPATAGNVLKCKDAVMRMTPHGGNGGEAECLRECLVMGPQRPEAVFFLGDGGWDGNELIREAANAIAARITIHGISFFDGGAEGNGLAEIAAMTGGGYRRITCVSQVSDARPVEDEKTTIKRNAWTGRVEPDSDDSEEEGSTKKGRNKKQKGTQDKKGRHHKLPKGTPWGQKPAAKGGRG